MSDLALRYPDCYVTADDNEQRVYVKDAFGHTMISYSYVYIENL